MKIKSQINITFLTDLPGEFTSLRERLNQIKGVVVIDSGNSPAILASGAKELAVISSVIPGDEGGKMEDERGLIFVEALPLFECNRGSLSDELFGDIDSEVVKVISAAYKQEGYTVKITRG